MSLFRVTNPRVPAVEDLSASQHGSIQRREPRTCDVLVVNQLVAVGVPHTLLICYRLLHWALRVRIFATPLCPALTTSLHVPLLIAAELALASHPAAL